MISDGPTYTYVTVLGDTLQRIAERFGHSGEGRAIREANPELQVEGDTPQPGLMIELPAAWFESAPEGDSDDT